MNITAGNLASHAPDAMFRQELQEFLNSRCTPVPFELSHAQLDQLRVLGPCLAAFYRAVNKLYRLSVEARQPAWIAAYFDAGKPESVVKLGRAKVFRDDVPAIIRPDVLLLEDGYAICELDSVPGGFGLAARIADSYRRLGYAIAGDVAIEDGFFDAVQAPNAGAATKVAIVVSDESKDYFPEMDWLAGRLRELGHVAHAIHPRKMRYSDDAASVEGHTSDIAVDTIYRFFELFDLPNVSKSELLLYLAKARRVRLTPTPKTYLEEKLAFALLHHPSLKRYWNDELNEFDRRVLESALPRTWILDPSPVPGHAVVPGLTVNNCAVQSWADLKNLSKRERHLVLKPSGFSELAWGSKGVVVGHDVSADEWSAALDHALASYPATVYVLQEYRSPARFSLPAYEAQGDGVELFEGRARLNPYYFVKDGKVSLSTILATVCPADKKKIHGMRDAVMTVCSPAGASTASITAKTGVRAVEAISGTRTPADPHH